MSIITNIQHFFEKFIRIGVDGTNDKDEQIRIEILNFIVLCHFISNSLLNIFVFYSGYYTTALLHISFVIILSFFTFFNSKHHYFYTRLFVGFIVSTMLFLCGYFLQNSAEFYLIIFFVFTSLAYKNNRLMLICGLYCAFLFLACRVLPPFTDKYYQWAGNWWLPYYYLISGTLFAFFIMRVFTSRYYALREEVTDKNILLTNTINNLNHKESIIVEQVEKYKKLNNINADLLRIITHDVRIPINNLIDLIDTSEANLEEKQRKEYFGLILEKAQRIKSNIDDVLINTNLQLDSETTTFNVYDEINQILLQFTENAKNKNIDFENEIDKDLMINVSSTYFTIIVRNLVSNALKFSNQNTKIIIFSKVENSKFIVLGIKDFGVGLSHLEINELNKGNIINNKKGTLGEKGTNIGLQIIFQIVTKFNCRITFSQNIPNGLIVAVSFPNIRCIE